MGAVNTMKTIITDRLLMINAGVFTLSLTNIEYTLKILLILISIVYTAIKIYKELKDRV